MGLREIQRAAASGPRLADLVQEDGGVASHAAVLEAAAPRLCASPHFEEALESLRCTRLRYAAARVCYLAVRFEDDEHVENRKRMAGADAIPQLLALVRDNATPAAALADAALALRFTVLGNGPWIEYATEVGAVEVIYGKILERVEAGPDAAAEAAAEAIGPAALSPLAALTEALVALTFADGNRGRVMNLEGAVDTLIAALPLPDAPAASRAAAVLHLVALEEAHRFRVAELGAVPPLLALFRGDDEDGRAEAAHALAVLSLERRNAPEIERAWAANPAPPSAFPPPPEPAPDGDEFDVADIVPLPVDDDGLPIGRPVGRLVAPHSPPPLPPAPDGEAEDLARQETVEALERPADAEIADGDLAGKPPPEPAAPPPPPPPPQRGEARRASQIPVLIGASLAHLAPSVPPPEARRTSALLAHTVAEDAVAPRRASQIPAVVGASLEHLAPPIPPPGRRTSAILAERLL